MKIMKTRLAVGSSIISIDTIEYQGKLWLVSHWLDSQDEKTTKPGRIIRMDILRYGPFRDGFFLQDPVPKELLDVETPKQPIDGFGVVELPDIHYPKPDRSKN